MTLTAEQLKAIAAEIAQFDVDGQLYAQNIKIDQSITSRHDIAVQFDVVSPSNTRGVRKGFIVSASGEHLPAA